MVNEAPRLPTCSQCRTVFVRGGYVTHPCEACLRELQASIDVPLFFAGLTNTRILEA